MEYARREFSKRPLKVIENHLIRTDRHGRILSLRGTSQIKGKKRVNQDDLT